MLFQHTAARRRLGFSVKEEIGNDMFQHTAARRRLADELHPRPAGMQVSTHSRPKAAGAVIRCVHILLLCFNTQPPEGGWNGMTSQKWQARVSTHSRPKAAGRMPTLSLSRAHCFNTQPPEGGWVKVVIFRWAWFCFNTQPPEGGWA